jgi:hypothetical protein
MDFLSTLSNMNGAGVKETDFLGYWITPTGLKPWLKCIKPILALAKPETLKHL